VIRQSAQVNPSKAEAEAPPEVPNPIKKNKTLLCGLRQPAYPAPLVALPAGFTFTTEGTLRGGKGQKKMNEMNEIKMELSALFGMKVISLACALSTRRQSRIGYNNGRQLAVLAEVVTVARRR